MDSKSPFRSTTSEVPTLDMMFRYPITERQRARFYIYKKQKNVKCLYIYTKIQTLCKNQDNLRYVFIHKKPDNLRYAIFNEIFEIGVYIYI